MRRTMLAVCLLVLTAAAAVAQQFPQTIPDQSVIGRIGAGGSSGPAQAIPFTTLSTFVQSSGFGNISDNFVYAGPTSGAAASPTFRLLVGADLPSPGASSLGGVEALTCSAHQWLNSIGTNGVPVCAQPAFSDISSVPVATSSQEGIVQGDGSTLLISAGVISCVNATTSQIGCSKPDGSTITASGGVLTAIGSSATSITVGTTTIGSQVNANDFLTANTTLADPGYGPTQLAHLTSCVNCGIHAVAATNNITFTLTDEGGNAISSTDPAVVCFRSDNATNAEISCVNITSAPSLSVHATSNMGVAGTSQPYRVWLALFNSSGTIYLGGMVAVNYTAMTVANIDDTNVASSTTCSGCTSANSAQTWYTTTGVSGKPFRLIGYVDFPAFSTNGDWQTATVVHMCGVGCIKPGQPTGNIQTVTVSSADSGTTSTSYATNSAMEVSITPISASNLVRVTMQGTLYTSNATAYCSARVIRGTSGNTIVGAVNGYGHNSNGTSVTVLGLDAPGTASSQTYAGQRVSSGTGTCIWPDEDAISGTTSVGYITAEEIQG